MGYVPGNLQLHSGRIDGARCWIFTYGAELRLTAMPEEDPEQAIQLLTYILWLAAGHKDLRD